MQPSVFEEWLDEPANRITGGKEGKTPARGPMLKPPQDEAEKVPFVVGTLDLVEFNLSKFDPHAQVDFEDRHNAFKKKQQDAAAAAAAAPDAAAGQSPKSPTVEVEVKRIFFVALNEVFAFGNILCRST